MFSKISFLSIHLVTICLVSVLVVTFLPGTGTATSGLVGIWNFDGNIKDYSENGNHRMNNGATFVQRIGGPEKALINEFKNFEKEELV